MKVNRKNYLCGVLTGVLAMLAIPAVAQEVSKSIDVSYRNIKIYADGNLVNTSGENEAFIYNGTTYLPVRAVGEAFNKAVDWDAKSSTVYLGSKPAFSTEPSVLLEDFDYFTKTAHIGDLGSSGKDNVGKTHGSGMAVRDGEVQYLLNGQYKRFAGVLGLSYDDRDAGDERSFKIYGDGKLLYSSPVFTGGVKPEAFNVDVTGVLNLKIEVENGYAKWLQIYDAGFYQ